MSKENRRHNRPTLLRFSDEQHEWLRTKAFIERSSIVHIIRELVDEAMKKEPIQLEVKR